MGRFQRLGGCIERGWIHRRRVRRGGRSRRLQSRALAFHAFGQGDVLESKDGGDNWIVHKPQGWGNGNAINFLYKPELGLGDSKTWLIGTQGSGTFRTTDAGATWKKVSDNGIQHGGGTIDYTKAGVLYATGGDTNQRSTDNGVTWTKVGPGGGYNGIVGDGKQLYTAKCFGPTAMITSPETDGVTWKDFNSQKFVRDRSKWRSTR